MTLAEILAQEGYSITEVKDYLKQHGIEISYSTIRNYCIASSHNYGRFEIWEAIDSFVIEHEIPWNDEW